jgi:hypothetical protein
MPIEELAQPGGVPRLIQGHPYPSASLRERPDIGSLDPFRPPGQLVNPHDRDNQEVFLRFLKIGKETFDVWHDRAGDEEQRVLARPRRRGRRVAARFADGHCVVAGVCWPFRGGKPLPPASGVTRCVENAGRRGGSPPVMARVEMMADIVNALTSGSDPTGAETMGSSPALTAAA